MPTLYLSGAVGFCLAHFLSSHDLRRVIPTKKPVTMRATNIAVSSLDIAVTGSTRSFEALSPVNEEECTSSEEKN